MTEFDADTVSLLQKRVYDMAGVTKGVSVSLNGKKIALSGRKDGNFKAYVEMYTSGANEVAGTGAKQAGANDDLVGADVGGVKTILYERFGERWEVAFAVSDGQFQQVSFCNSIATTKGGTHVNYVADQIVSGIVDLVKKVCWVPSFSPGT